MGMDICMMMQQTKHLLKNIFALPEVERVAIKDVVIEKADDEDAVRKGVAACYHDHMSDVDVHLWIRLNPADTRENHHFYQHHLSRLGLGDEIFGILFQPRDGENAEGIRLVLSSMFRMDMIIHVKEDEAAPVIGQAVNYSASLEREKYDAFWFIAIQALAKLLRRDYLIADHLAHMLLMEGLVLQMVDRDKQYGMNFHRFGYAEKLAYLDADLSTVETLFHTADSTYNHIAENLLRAAASYEALVQRSATTCERKGKQFVEMWESYLCGQTTGLQEKTL